MANVPTKRYADIVIVVPLTEEFRRVEKILGTPAQEVHGTHVVSIFTYSELTLVAVLQVGMGKTHAIAAAEFAHQLFEIGIFAVLGIAGGLSSDVAIGDICISGTIIDVLDNAKAADTPSNGLKLSFNPTYFSTDDLLTFAVKYASIGVDIREVYENWQLEAYDTGSKLLPFEFKGRGGKNEKISLPRVHDGNIVCGSVSQSRHYNEQMKGMDRKVLAVETESGGVFFIAKRNNIPAIAIRGICDYADPNKSALEDETGSKARTIAADNATSFLLMQLKNSQFLQFLKERKNGEQMTLLSTLTEEGRFEEESLQSAKQEAHRQLGQLSPEYSGKPEGFLLPLPRVMSSSSTITVSAAIARKDPISVLEAISTDRVIAMDVPRSYPDKGLPWVIAAAVSRISLHGKQAVPLVVEGRLLTPPRGTLAQHSGIDLERLNASASSRPIVIIRDLPPGSSSRTEFLDSEIAKYPEARFIIVNSNDLSISEQSELILRGVATKVTLCDVSLSEMTEFFQRTLAIAGQEASVVAFKLYSMFRRFKLNAHPTYFAGVSQDSINALLNANKRGELIQLAVSGCLSFIVAEDRDSVVLTRTTRELFLKQFVLDTRIRGSKLDRAGLIAYIEAFAHEGDFDIEPVEFLVAFQNRGLIGYDGFGHARVNLPFIEAYLLAVGLKDFPDEALSYFNPKLNSFDNFAFDIYCELGPDPRIVSAISKNLQDVIEEFRVASTAEHVLLTNTIQPRGLRSVTRLEQLQSRLQKAVEDVVESRPNKEQKQSLIDLAERVENGAKQAQENSQNHLTDSEQQTLDRLKKPFDVWAAAVVMLGSGAERIPRDPKRALALQIVEATSALLDALVKAFPPEIFNRLREQFESDEFLLQVTKGKPGAEIDDNIRELVRALLDAFELSFLTLPFRIVIGQLCNSANQQVLRKTIGSVETHSVMERLIAKIWAAEISASKEKSELVAAISHAPPAPFLRFALYQHLIARVFWTQWRMADQLALLDAAEECLAPLDDKHMDKGRVKRQVVSANRKKGGGKSEGQGSNRRGRRYSR